MINPAPIPSELSLNTGDHDELKIFLEIRLIPSRIDQKLKNKEEKYMLLKREIGTTIVGHWSGCGGGLMASRGRFLGRGSWLQFRLRISYILAAIGPRLGHDRATIGPRSWSWWFVDRRLLDWRRFHHANSPIATRSSRDLRVLPEPLHAVRSIIRRLEGHNRVIVIHSPRPSDGDPTVLMRRAATCLKKIN